MSWPLLLGIVVVLGLLFFAALVRRRELARMRDTISERERVVRQGGDEAKLQHPVVDLSRCLGCATCVAVCPEDNVLELVHGQAVVVNGARCEGIAACERECPVGAITVTIANLEERTDIPALDGLEAIGSPGLFLAGEVTAHALIKVAIEHGTAVAAEVARRAPDGDREEDVLDLCVVGAGPAGLACSLEAQRHGLDFVTIDQEDRPGGTVAKYPRRKLVMTQPVELPLHGRMRRTTYEKEELIDLWQGLADDHALPIHGGQVFTSVERVEGHYLVHTKTDTFRARHVCLALGRRGTPRKLGVPGEDLPHVAHSLLDANSYQGRRILVVGGGDTAVETALGLAEQPGNEVTLSYRKESFFRVRGKNMERLKAAVQSDRINVLTTSDVLAIRPGEADLEVSHGADRVPCTVPADDVFVMAGGTPPFEVLEKSGVSFDSSLMESPELGERGTGLVRALGAALVLALVALVFALWHSDYYRLPLSERPMHPKHQLLRPGLNVGLGLGIAAASLVVINLLYLLRRSMLIRFGSLQAWMTSHVATGIMALLCALLHGAMAPRDSAGGHALWGLVALMVTGAIGRYFYAYVPRAANGRELELSEVKAEFEAISDDLESGERRFREHARTHVRTMLETRQWKSTFFGRVLALFGVQRDLRRVLSEIRVAGLSEGVDADEIEKTQLLAKRAHKKALVAAHYEDLRAILGTWRYLHRYMSMLMILLLVLHLISALAFASFGGGG
ncbi:MAG: NAD(P)-binding domain-containing protein [Planctomycetota bacterium]|jgi:thioredoxin reductase/Pyruvate/2-oxoacid:ferredoxin oxidoreductase delta subunit